MEGMAALEARVREANIALHAARDVETEKRNRGLVGKCFKFHNSYSCPEKPSDYWWVYYRVISVDGAEVVAHEFQTDSRGKIEIDFKRSLYWWHGVADGYQPSTVAEFNKAWRALKKKIAVYGE